jgi:hypothetical protein
MNRKKAPPDIYYVYLYLRPEDDGDGPAGTPYYAGKGKDLRAFGKNHSCDVPQGKENIVFVATGLSESDAFQRERDQIRLYGRIGVEEGGCLLNRSSGGNGASGRIMPEEERLCRIAQIGAREAKLTPEQRLARTEATRKRKREYLARLTPEQRLAQAEHASMANTAYFQNLTTEQRFQHAERTRKYWASLTEEQKLAMHEGQRVWWRSLSEEDKQKRLLTLRVGGVPFSKTVGQEYWDSLTPEQLSAVCEARAQQYAALPAEKKLAQSQLLNAGLLGYWAEITEEQQRNRALKLSQTAREQWANATEQQKDEWGRSRGAALKMAYATLPAEKKLIQNQRLNVGLLKRWSAPKATQCKHGHPYDAGNTGMDSSGFRYCKTCHKGQRLALAKAKMARFPKVVRNSTGLVGAFAQGEMWYSKLRRKGITYRSPLYESPEEAATYYDAKARELDGPAK